MTNPLWTTIERRRDAITIDDAHFLATLGGETDRDRIANRLGVSTGTLERHLYRAQRDGNRYAADVLATTLAGRRERA